MSQPSWGGDGGMITVMRTMVMMFVDLYAAVLLFTRIFFFFFKVRLQSLCQVSRYFRAGAGIACRLERRTRDRKVASSNPDRSGGGISSPE